MSARVVAVIGAGERDAEPALVLADLPAMDDLADGAPRSRQGTSSASTSGSERWP